MTTKEGLESFVSEKLTNIDILINCSKTIHIISEIIEVVNKQSLDKTSYEITDDVKGEILTKLKKIEKEIFTVRKPFERIEHLKELQQYIEYAKQLKKDFENENNQKQTKTTPTWGLEKAQSETTKATGFQVPCFKAEDNGEEGCS